MKGDDDLRFGDVSGGGGSSGILGTVDTLIQLGLRGLVLLVILYALGETAVILFDIPWPF